MRFRSVILALSRALFGLDIGIPDFPGLKSVRGFGISDSDVYSGELHKAFTYTNTFYQRQPAFDLMHPDESQFGKYDFVICSEVLEHVSAPVETAFRTLAQLLKPSGVLILTVPFTLEQTTAEHFSDLNETGIAQVGGRTVMVNRGRDGQYQVYDDLVFHGGQGSTLEMRVFSEADLRAKLINAGLCEIAFDTSGSRKFGVVFSNHFSLPITARKQAFSLDSGGVTELVKQWLEAKTLLRAVRRSRWVRLGRLCHVGPALKGMPGYEE
jgi:SAM-dependent methyltransferase